MCRRAARAAPLPSTPGRVAPRSRPVTGEALPAPWCCRQSVAGPCCRRAALPAGCRVLPACCPARQLPARCPTLPAGHWGSVAGPWCCPVKIGPTLPAPWCCRRAAAAGRLPTCCRPVNSRPGCPTLPAGHWEALPAVVLPVEIGPTLPAPWCCPRAAVPAGCRRAGCRSTLLYPAQARRPT